MSDIAPQASRPAPAPVAGAVRSRAEIATPAAAKYLSQLCKHFAHKLPVTLEGDAGQIRFGTGVCDLTAEGGTLTLTCTAPDDAELVSLQNVVARHLVRFAFREPDMAIDWQGA